MFQASRAWKRLCWILTLDWLLCVWVAQPCPTLCDPMDCSPPRSSVHGILQARTLACSHSLLQGMFPTQGLKLGLLHCRWIPHWATGEALWLTSGPDIKIPGKSLSFRMWRWCSAIWHTRLLDKSNANLILESYVHYFSPRKLLWNCSLSLQEMCLSTVTGLVELPPPGRTSCVPFPAGGLHPLVLECLVYFWRFSLLSSLLWA